MKFIICFPTILGEIWPSSHHYYFLNISKVFHFWTQVGSYFFVPWKSGWPCDLLWLMKYEQKRCVTSGKKFSKPVWYGLPGSLFLTRWLCKCIKKEHPSAWIPHYCDEQNLFASVHWMGHMRKTSFLPW